VLGRRSEPVAPARCRRDSVPGPAYTRTISAALRPGPSGSTRYWCSLNVDQIKTRFKKTVREECERRGVDRS
jgi:hypothetical protein